MLQPHSPPLNSQQDPLCRVKHLPCSLFPVFWGVWGGNFTPQEPQALPSFFPRHPPPIFHIFVPFLCSASCFHTSPTFPSKCHCRRRKSWAENPKDSKAAGKKKNQPGLFLTGMGTIPTLMISLDFFSLPGTAPGIRERSKTSKERAEFSQILIGFFCNDPAAPCVLLEWWHFPFFLGIFTLPPAEEDLGLRGGA